jgi:hypothetical protein
MQQLAVVHNGAVHTSVFTRPLDAGRADSKHTSALK